MSETKLPLRLPVLPDEVRSPDDRIACEPYHAVLFARVCAERQRVAGIAMRQRAADTPKVAGWRSNLLVGDYALCIGCAPGAVVARALGHEPAPEPLPRRLPRVRRPVPPLVDGEWRAVAGFGGMYQVSRAGEVRRRPRAPGAAAGPALQVVKGRVRLMEERRQVAVEVSQLVREAWGAAAGASA